MLGDDMPRWQRLADVVLRVSWGGDCYAYGLLALGHIDVIAEVTMKLWDWAALVPVIEELAEDHRLVWPSATAGRRRPRVGGG